MNDPSGRQLLHTTVRIKGANCSICFNEAFEELRRTGGVFEVHGSIATQSIEIAHNDAISIDALSAIVRDRVHGIEMYANEIRMVPLQTETPQPECRHA